MTISNRITITRIALTPAIFVLFFYFVIGNIFPTVSLILLWVFFIGAEISDLLDGYLARKRNEVSDVGKLLDPFADVVLRVTFFFCFTYMKIMPAWAFMIILYRELSILIIRMLVVQRGYTMAARKGGKLKSLLYFFSSLFGMIYITIPHLSFIALTDEMELVSTYIITGVFALASIASLVSLADYLVFLSRKAKEQ